LNRPRARRGRNLNEILAERRARRLERLRVFLLGAGLFVLVAWLVRSMLEERTNPEFAANRVVVVPFDNRTGNSALDTLGLVASDWITRVLSLYAPAREVVPTTSMLAYRNSARLGRFDLQTRAQRFGRGTRSPLVVWGSFFQTGDSLRFSVEITNLENALMVGSIPAIAAPADSPMLAVDRLRSAVVGELMHTESLSRPIRRRVPERLAYQAYVNGLSDYMQRRYAAAAERFAYASERDSGFVSPQIWQVEALFRARSFERADMASRKYRRARTTHADAARAMRGFTRLRADLLNSYRWSVTLLAQNGADDLAEWELALDAMALGRVREARRLFSEMSPHRGVLHGRPDYYLHYAAAFHLVNNHRAELRVVRDGLLASHRSLDVRLANCRVRAALAEMVEASHALNVLAASDTDTASEIPLSHALQDCAAELDAHGLPELGSRARFYAHSYNAPTMRRDSAFEPGHVDLEEARRAGEYGDLKSALDLLGNSVGADLPFYEPGRMMLHAEPSFRRLRNTRGFLRLIHPRG
jgi:hypothetical protein